MTADLFGMALLVMIAPIMIVFCFGVAAFVLVLAGMLIFQGIVIPWWWVAHYVSGKRIRKPPSERYGRFDFYD